MKKKILIALFVIAAIVCMFASCGECEHAEYEVKSTVKATCTAEGKTIEACKECGEEKTTAIPKIDHKYKWETIPMTCQTDGKSVGTCQVCKLVTEKDIVPASENGHNIEKDVEIVPATCTTAGKRGEICSICGADKTGLFYNTVIPALGHTYDRTGLLTDEEKGISFVHGDCENEGYISRICQEEGCGATDHITKDEYALLEGTPDFDSELFGQMDKIGHSWESEQWTPDLDEAIDVVPATCTTAGYKTFECKNKCGKTYNHPTDDPLGHEYVKDNTAVEGTHYQITLQPTCISTGTKAYICITCQELDSVNVEELPIVPHNIVDDGTCTMLDSKDATCTDKAYKVYKCNVDALCNETKTFYYDGPLGHVWEQNGKPTCATEGLTPWKCARCEFEETRDDEFADHDIRHTFGSVDTVATCCDRAIFKCSICEKTYTSYEDDPTGDPTNTHVYDAFVETIAPTCSAEGYTTYGCSAGNCGTTKNDEYTDRVDHEFNPVTEDGRIVCIKCATQYRDVSTEITSGSGSLCLGCEKEVCECDLKVEWNGYVSPKEPEKITANTLFTKTEVVWTEVEEKTSPLALGKGEIILNGAVETTYEVKVYNTDGELLATFSETGEVVLIDLYKYEDVAKVEITASTDAEAYFYAIVE